MVFLDKLILVFDCLKDPRDMANIIHLSLATNTKVILTGNSLPKNHYKVLKILNSWIPNISEKEIEKKVKNEMDFFKCIEKLKKNKYTIYGTSPNFGENFYKKDFRKLKHAIIFGTESSGLSKEKITKMEEIVQIPMKNNTRFYTITTIAPAITLEILRQKKLI